jgi:glycosyltransferase involved in cell wall biosynthesis
MKLLVFAHVPPPHHGQSYMVQLMLNGFGGDCCKSRDKSGARNTYGIDCYHVDARFSKSLADIGELQIGKLPLILFYCLQAIWCRFRYGATAFYYVPAPGKSVALYRDWLVMFLCRPFFKEIILHWHAAGLAKWLETSVQIRTRAVTYHAFKRAGLSVVISNYNVADAEKLLPRRIRVVSNGIPDPCPNFRESILPRRRARFAARAKLFANEPLSPDDLEKTGGDPQVVKVLFLAHCTREKGLFATAQAVLAANQILSAGQSPVRMKLFAAGSFVVSEEKAEFDRLLKNPEFNNAVNYLGFVSGAEKERALREADLFCFPTCYIGENQPVNLIEAMAFGLPIVTTRWRSLPEMLPLNYPGLVDSQSPEPITAALIRLMNERSGETMRENFLGRFTIECHLENLAKAFHSLETAALAWPPVAQNSQTATPHNI